MEKEHFTAREVGTLIENLEGKFNLVLEIVVPLRTDMVDVKQRLSSLETEVRSIKDTIRVAFPAMNERFSRIETKLGI